MYYTYLKRVWFVLGNEKLASMPIGRAVASGAAPGAAAVPAAAAEEKKGEYCDVGWNLYKIQWITLNPSN